MGKGKPVFPREMMRLSDEAWGKIEVLFERMVDLNDLMKHFRQEEGGELLVFLAIAFFFTYMQEK